MCRPRDSSLTGVVDERLILLRGLVGGGRRCWKASSLGFQEVSSDDGIVVGSVVSFSLSLLDGVVHGICRR